MARGFGTGLVQGIVVGAAALVALSLIAPLPQRSPGGDLGGQGAASVGRGTGDSVSPAEASGPDAVGDAITASEPEPGTDMPSDEASGAAASSADAAQVAGAGKPDVPDTDPSTEAVGTRAVEAAPPRLAATAPARAEPTHSDATPTATTGGAVAVDRPAAPVIAAAPPQDVEAAPKPPAASVARPISVGAPLAPEALDRRDNAPAGEHRNAAPVTRPAVPRPVPGTRDPRAITPRAPEGANTAAQAAAPAGVELSTTQAALAATGAPDAAKPEAPPSVSVAPLLPPAERQAPEAAAPSGDAASGPSLPAPDLSLPPSFSDLAP